MISIIEKQKKRRAKIKYTILGFNQIEAIKLGLSTDDLAILRWFMDFKSTDSMERNYIEEINDMGFWVDYSTLIDALPILLSDGNTYLQRFIELEQLLQDVKFKEYKEKKKKYHDTNRKKVQRILAGPLSQILKKDDMKVLGSEKGSKIYIYVDKENYSKLLLNTNMETYLAENGITIEKKSPVDNVDNIDKEKVVGDTSVSPVGDTSVSPVGDTSVSPVGDTSVSPVGDTSVSPVGDTSVSPVGDTSVSPDSSSKNSCLKNSSIKKSKLNNPSSIDDLSIKHLINLKSKEEKVKYLESKFDLTPEKIEHILIAMDFGVEEGSIKSPKDSLGYWIYIYKACKSRHEKKLTHNCNYELAQ